MSIPEHDVCKVSRLEVVSSPSDPFPIEGEILGYPEDGIGRALPLMLAEFLVESSG